MSSLGLLDSVGNINPNKLEKELARALEFDARYRQTDNMKKRACKVAKSYDEFKEMVAASHLGRLSRKEIESLSDKKKGWHQDSAKSTSKLNVLQDELEHENKRSTKAIASACSIPQNSMEFQRNWRRLKDITAKCSFLLEVGTERMCILLQRDDDAEVFEDVLRTLTSFIDAGEGCARVNEEELQSWMADIASISRFNMLINFVSRDVRNAAFMWLISKTNADESLAHRYRGS